MALPFWWNDVRGVFARRNVPVSIWAPILIAESSGVHTAHNKGTREVPEDSVGLFQLNRKGGQGVGYSVDQLMMPALNAEIAARYIEPAYRQCGNNVSCVAVNSGHPGLVPVSDPRVRRIAQISTAWGASTGRSEEQAWLEGLRLNGSSLPPGPGEPGPGQPGPGFPLPMPWEVLNPALWPGLFWDGIAEMLSLPTRADLAWSALFGGVGLAFVLIGANGMIMASPAGGVIRETTRTITQGAAAAYGGGVGAAAGAAAAGGAGRVRTVSRARRAAARTFDAIEARPGQYVALPAADRAEALGILGPG